MSILIKGMEMPENCAECEISQAYDIRSTWCPLTFTTQAELKRQDNCPLIELSPHGDLIDRSKLAWTPIDITDLPFGECLPVYLKEDVDSASIVIESEE